MAASSATFKEYEFNIDIGDASIDTTMSKGYPMMYRLKEIKDTIPKLKNTYYEVLSLRSKNIFISTNAKTLYEYPDSLKAKK
ncbi:hypothetical protein [Polaribacter ponticola]|uniref:Uncharacterized protein n=1 Tax=Polaribacter ponticola TaxID=2978475 RepID=A0ABT5SCS0_9FLAO|nr:hypothetical protein [Polaribacter sp. MSW5]MDD7915922.1 hypothetical protein [Polaribacter sp. MSW5]